VQCTAQRAEIGVIASQHHLLTGASLAEIDGFCGIGEQLMTGQ